jgi:hypothetical protein
MIDFDVAEKEPAIDIPPVNKTPQEIMQALFKKKALTRRR